MPENAEILRLAQDDRLETAGVRIEKIQTKAGDHAGSSLRDWEGRTAVCPYKG